MNLAHIQTVTLSSRRLGERGGSVVECRTPEREVRGSRPTAAVLCPWARHFTPRKYWLLTQEAMAPSRHDWKIVDWNVKPQHNQPLDVSWVGRNLLCIFINLSNINRNRDNQWISYHFCQFSFIFILFNLLDVDKMKREHDLNLFIIHMSVDIFKQIRQLKIYHKYKHIHAC